MATVLTEDEFEKVWKQTEADWIAADARVKAAEKVREKYRDDLIKLAPKGYKGDAIELIRSIPDDRVSYKSIVDELYPDLDTSPWAKASKPYYRICTVKDE